VQSGMILPTIKMPIGFQRKFDDEYLNSRKFLPKDYINHPSGYTRMISKLINYILVGVVQHKELKGYMGRCISEELEDSGAPKYLNSKNTDFAQMLFNYDSINYNTRVGIIVEGGFDAISTENELELYKGDEIKTVGSFGKKLSDNQLNLLKQTNIETLIFLWDAKDAIDEIKTYTFEAKKHFDVYVGIEMVGDPGSWSADTFQKVLSNLYTPNQIWTDKINPKRLKV
jgi:hypothetical protein